MALEKNISDQTLAHYQRLANVKYSNLYKTLQSKTKLASGELSDPVEKYGKLFSSIVHLVQEEVKQEPLYDVVEANDFPVMYAAYLAARIAGQEAQASCQQGRTNSLVLGRGDKEKRLVARGKTDYTMVRIALEQMVDYLSNSRQSSDEAAGNFFGYYSNQAADELRTMLPRKLYEEIKAVQWKIGPYEVDGIKRVAKEVAEEISSVHKKEQGQFHTPLQYLPIPKDKMLPRNRIVGNQAVITELERAVKCLFMFNPTVGRNPMQEKRMFNNKFILQGMPGEGKGAVSFYIINYAEQLNARVQGDLHVTCFDIDSSYEDGKIQKLKSQFQQIVSQNRLFLIYEDELNGMLKQESPAHQKKSDLQVIQEFNKFLDGQYPDKGNYLLLGNVNDLSDLSLANRSRFAIRNWQGAVTQEQKATLFGFKLEQGRQAGYVQISEKDIAQLGELAVQHGLSGRNITHISDKVCADTFRWDNLADIYEMRHDYAGQLQRIDELHHRITFADIERELLEFVRHREDGDADARRFQVA